MRCTLVSAMDRFHNRAVRTGTHLFIGNLTTSLRMPYPYRSLRRQSSTTRRRTPHEPKRLSSSSFSAPFFLLNLVYLSGYWSTKKKASINKIWSIIPRPFVSSSDPSSDPSACSRVNKSRNEGNRKLCSVLQRAKSKDLSALA